ncbi:type IV secretory system conjugative DNA transfer family protein (plasmid) [Erwinia pyri]|uniref:Type IV secretory system conjugative DNA transfer family protein n=1 Tax=Erwinia pyri TaxID=3062598 RepID=A0AA50DNX9_9GAMM|nr:type IV secretory system conjugative DNA transfer family protein [Erwinia sp. DE2]WLS81222.1 type IV secretory system conjugative DNA transfer family protein [Erwinia sp. DE2]
MSVKLPDKAQWAFITFVMCLFTYYFASVAIYFFNHKTPLYIWRHFDSLLLWQLITDGSIRSDIRFTVIPSILSGLVASLVIPAFIIWKLNKDAFFLYGDAKFASDDDLKNSKLLKWERENEDDILVGEYKGKYLWYTAPDFVSLGAGTRAGKGAAIGIPNMLVRKHSLIALDPKQELWKITSKVREILLGNKVYLLDPFNSKTHQFNPLFYIDLKVESGAKDLLKLIEILFPSYGLTGAEAHFNNLAGQYWTGLAKLLHFFINHAPDWLEEFNLKPVFSIGSVVDLYSNIDRENILNNREDFEGTEGLDDNAMFHLRDALTKIREYHETEDEQRSSIDGSFRKKMSLFYLPTVRKCTDGNDFDLRQLRREDITIYVGVNAEDMSLAYDFLNLFFNFVVEVTLRENPDFDPTLKHDCLMFLDEFPSIGYMPIIKKGSGYIAGFKLKLLTIYQNISQLNEIYGIEGAKTLMSAHPCRIIYAVSEEDDAKKISEKLGYITAKSTGSSKTDGLTGRGSSSENEAQRALVLPQELGTLAFTEEFIILKGEYPVKAKKALYYLDPYFMNRLMLVSPKLSALTSKINNTTNIFNARGLKYPSKEKMLSLGELESEVLL